MRKNIQRYTQRNIQKRNYITTVSPYSQKPDKMWRYIYTTLGVGIGYSIFRYINTYTIQDHKRTLDKIKNVKDNIKENHIDTTNTIKNNTKDIFENIDKNIKN